MYSGGGDRAVAAWLWATGKAPDALQDDSAKAELDSLQGVWEAQAAEFDGAALPDEEARRLRVAIKGNRMLLIPGGEWTPSAIALDLTNNPKVLHATPTEGPEKGKTLSMIYEIDKAADTLKLCWNVRDAKPVPTEFGTKSDPGLLLATLKHEPHGLPVWRLDESTDCEQPPPCCR